MFGEARKDKTRQDETSHTAVAADADAADFVDDDFDLDFDPFTDLVVELDSSDLSLFFFVNCAMYVFCLALFTFRRFATFFSSTSVRQNSVSIRLICGLPFR